MASKFIENLNESVKKVQMVEETTRLESAPKTDPFVEYRKAYESQKPVSITFDSADDAGNLSAIDENGITLMFKNELVTQSISFYKKSLRSKFIACEIICKISSIDEENKVIYVVGGKDRDYNIKGAIISQLAKSLDKNKTLEAAGEQPESIKVFGRVQNITFDGRIAYVDVLCRGVRGRLNVADWQKSYLRDLHNVCNEGEIYEFEVKKLVSKKDAIPLFTLSRVNLTPDPWEEIVGNLPTRETVLVCKAVELPVGKHYAWAVSPRYPGIEIIMRLTDKLIIKPGLNYKCKVVEVNTGDTKKFVVVPFESADISEKVVRFVGLKQNRANGKRTSGNKSEN